MWYAGIDWANDQCAMSRSALFPQRVGIGEKCRRSRD